MSKTISLEMVKQAGVLLKKEHELRLEFEKKAQDLELEKRAMKLAFKEVELGYSNPFQNYEAFHKKIASLMNDDLDVLEKALDRGYSGSFNSGELDSPQKEIGGKEVFFNWVMNGEF